MHFKPAEFKRRRKELMRRIGKQSIAIVAAAPEKIRNRDADYAYRPDSDFYYLTGFAEPEAIAVFVPGRKEGQFIIFCREKNPEMETWTGRRVGVKAAPKTLEADEAWPIDKADELIPQLLQDRHQVFVSFGNDQDFDTRMIKWINGVRRLSRSGVHAPQHLISLESVLHEMRLIKSPAESKVMHKAARISAEAHCRAMQTCKPNLFEYEVEAELLHVFRKHGCETAYNSIVGGGDNACILHYVENSDALHDGDLLLIDAGAELNFYASDITRTFPVNGRFSPEQRQLYQLVLDANYAAIKEVRPGNHWNKPHETAVRVLTKGLVKLKLLKGKIETLIEKQAYRKFYMHRTGHWLGMDVHDVGEYRINGKWRKLEPGMVLTVEPGLYIAHGTKGVHKKWWGIGIRIEDDVLVTKKGNQVLTEDVPKEVDEIEALMAR
ncbi:MAG: Xaa-Pro aminopeptidase [Gammaproteobacteria bacterium]|nr:Xaa-Pro aminopeptidase [Gammaproteobacteria bacterium]